MATGDKSDTQALIGQYIEPDAVAPERAYLRDSGGHVWALIEHLQKVDPDPRKLAEEFDVPYEAVKAALAYYQLHKARIDAKILLNSPA